ncbi:MAG: DUF1634 domain-containing protein [Deltaproteobacteria bacterium]|nr:DUF1634 domain-containing protein [Deltaproteobacteria bacterium]
MQRLLQSGLVLACLLMLAGLGAQLASGGRRSQPVRLDDIFHAPLGLGERLMALGVLVLAMTPALRVLMLVVLWARERDSKYVGVALTVVATLGLALALGGG